MGKVRRGSADRVLGFIIDFRDARGISPSIREIGFGVGINSTSYVKLLLEDLAGEGFITLPPTESGIRMARGIVPTGKWRTHETEN